MLHLPVLRAGVPYRSLSRSVLKDVRNDEPVAEVSQANRGLISRDLLGMGDLPVEPGAGATQSAEDFVRCQSATTGMPESLCRANMEKIRFVLAEMASLISDDPDLRRELLIARHIDRLNLGALPTGTVSWDQPHEGNLFEHFYRQRAYQEEAQAS